VRDTVVVVVVVVGGLEGQRFAARCNACGAVLKPRRETVNLLLDAVTHTAPTAGRNVHGVMALMRLLTLDHCRP